jgi:adenosine deaminase
MNQANLNSIHKFIRSLPKIDLHRHMEGSLRLETLKEILGAHALDLTNNNIASLVQIQETDPLTFENFLSKFQPLRQFYQSPEIISRIAYETVADAAKDGIKYVEIRFTPVALTRYKPFPMGDAMDWVIAGVEKGCQAYQISSNLIVSVNRHESPALAEEVAQLAVDRINKGIVGLDLAGNEAEFSALPFSPIFREAKQAGLKITIHAGEWGGPENVKEAIVSLQTDRIGHGVRVLESPEVVRLARDHQIPFEVCLTSNYHSGVVPDPIQHPIIQMIAENLVTTLNTDDPAISQIDLSKEYLFAHQKLNISLNQLKHLIITSADAAFISEKEKEKLKAQIQAAFDSKEK